jgi:hypothetical protein
VDQILKRQQLFQSQEIHEIEEIIRKEAQTVLRYKEQVVGVCKQMAEDADSFLV